MKPSLLATLALALLVPAASADHWNDDTPTSYLGDSTCRISQVTVDPSCAVAYACTGGSPPQIVDTALHCGGRLAEEASPIAASLGFYAWSVADGYTLVVQNNANAAAATVQPTADEFNAVGCSTIWSFFCANPVIVSGHMPVNDPINDYPDQLPGPY
jgi:hypothetical protein